MGQALSLVKFEKESLSAPRPNGTLAEQVEDGHPLGQCRLCQPGLV